MITFCVASLRRGIQLVRTHRSFLYTLALLVVIPAAFLLSGQQFLNVAQEHHDRAEYARIGLLHDVFVAYAEETRMNREGLRAIVANIGPINPDLKTFSLITLEEGELAQEALWGAPIDLEHYGDIVRAAAVRTDESLVFETYESGEHVRLGIRAIHRGELTAPSMVFTSFSLAAGDALYAEKIRTAYLSLAFLTLIVLFFILRHAHIINYAEIAAHLKEALAVRTTFINMTAHELRSPLTAIRGYANMLRERLRSEEDKTYAARIEESSAYMIQLVSDMLDVAKIESGSAALARDICSVRDVAQNVVERLESLGKEHGIALRMDRMSPDLRIVVDKTRLEQILINLVSNAIKYTKQGSVTLAALSTRGTCEIRIKDTGSGMTAQDQQRLFAPFFRTSEATRSGIAGAGLGMWITKQFIEAMGGSVAVESIHSVGTHVVVTFPLAHT